MRIRIAVILAYSFAFTASPAGAEPGAISATCSLSDSDQCIISWDFSANPKDGYTVQRFDALKKEWMTEFADATLYGEASRPSRPGNLYRVVGCSNSGNDCTSSSAFWVPVVSKSVDDIPSIVTSRSGQVMTISKELPRVQTQMIQHNVYLFVRDFEDVDMTELPIMEEPVEVPQTLVEIIQDNVHWNYYAMQQKALGNPIDPGPELPDAQNIHPHGHPEHAHDHAPQYSSDQK